jgi:hypothetical protein
MQDLMVDAIEEVERKEFFRQMAVAYESLETDPAAYKEEQERLSHLDATLTDGLQGSVDDRSASATRGPLAGEPVKQAIG